MGNKLSNSPSRKLRLSPKPPTVKRSKSPASVVSSNGGSSSDTIVRQGRTFHNLMESIYWLPNDDEEMDRLVGQHFALKELFGGNILKEVYDIVQFDEGASVLDVGCGPGTWIMDSATDFPACKFVGVDISSVFPSDIRPANVSFQYGNVLERLPFDDNTFDMVNLRFFMLALRKDEWHGVFKEIRRILKPNGVLQSTEAGMLDRGNEFVLYAGEVFKNVMISRDQEPYIAFKLQTILKECGFDVLKVDQRDTYLGEKDKLNREFLWDVCNIFKSAQPFLTEPLNVAPEAYPEFLDKLYTECQKTPQGQWLLSITLAQKPSQSIH